MLLHETPGRRYDNHRIDTDAALRAVSDFPRLKRLYLHKGQATDEGLMSLTQLTELEELMVWNAVQLTDAGIAHLAGLPKVRNVHFSNGQLGDAFLKVFSRMPNLKLLSLQGNAFSDDGLKHLAEFKQLRSLWIGMNQRPLTDAGAQHLAGLTALEELDLQGAQLSDATVAALKDLKQLRMLYLNAPSRGGPITDASIEHLLGMSKLQNLGIQNTRLTEQGVKRLLALPELKELLVSRSAISEGLQAQLEKQRPSLRLFISGSPDDN
jgi:internalin A